MANLTMPALLGYVEQHVRELFPVLRKVSAFEESRSEADLLPPCFQFEVTGGDLDPDNDPQNGQKAWTLRFEGRLIATLDMLKSDVFALALDMASAFHRTRMGVPQGFIVSPAHVIGINDDAFRPELDQFRVWTIEWTQEVWLGSSVFDEDGTPLPSSVFVSSAPLTGPAHIGDYQQLMP